MQHDDFRKELGLHLGDEAKRCLRQAWTERSGNSDPKSVERVIDKITKDREWATEFADSEILLRALEIATEAGEALDQRDEELRTLRQKVALRWLTR